MGNKLLELLTLGSRLKQYGNTAMHAGIGAHMAASTGDIFGIPGFRQLRTVLSPGTYIDKSGIRPLINAKNAYEDAVGRAYEGVNPWIARDEFHSAYDPTGRFAGATDVAARAGDVIRNTGAGLATFPLPAAALPMLGLNVFDQGLKYGLGTYNNPLQSNMWRKDKYMPIIPSGVDGMSLTPEEIHYNEKAKEHNKRINDPIDDSDFVWAHANQRTRQLQDLITRAVTEGHQKKMSTAQINARIRKIKSEFGYRGSDVLRAGSRNAGDEQGGYSNVVNETEAKAIVGNRPLQYGYNSWDRR